MSSTSVPGPHKHPELKLSNRYNKTQNHEDIELLRRAHLLSNTISKIVQNNSLQKDYLRSLDQFIKSIETKLDEVERFFDLSKTTAPIDHKKTEDDSTATLQHLCETLVTIKNSVFSNTVNLEGLNRILDEHYNHLLPSIYTSGDLGFNEKILTALHFIDGKISQFVDLVDSKGEALLKLENPVQLNTKDSIKQYHVKFHNYEHCYTKGSSKLLHYFELPFPWRENPYIIHGYRFHTKTSQALKSICQCHNETGNIWTHLLGAMLMTYIGLFTYPKSELYLKSTFTDNLIIYLYLAASIKCLLSSSFWHAFSGTSNLYLRKKFACVDFTGITVLITAAVITTEYSALYYYPTLKTGIIVFSLACGIYGFYLNWSPRFHRSESKGFRILFYICLSLLGAAAFAILAYYKGFVHALKFYSPVIRSGIWYLIGVVFYSSLVPEIFRTDVVLDVEQLAEAELIQERVANNVDSYFKEKPTLRENHNSFFSLWWIDYIFMSHNIWHVFVLLGALGHYAAAYEMFMNIPLNK